MNYIYQSSTGFQKCAVVRLGGLPQTFESLDAAILVTNDLHASNPMTFYFVIGSTVAVPLLPFSFCYCNNYYHLAPTNWGV